MNYFIDTNIIIYALKNSYPSIIKKFESIPSYNIFIPSIVKAEIDYGIAKSKNPKLTRELYNKFLSIYSVVPFSEKETKIYGDIRYQLEKEGKLIGAVVSGADFIDIGTPESLDEFNKSKKSEKEE